jgi:hypothetical protein
MIAAEADMGCLQYLPEPWALAARHAGRWLVLSTIVAWIAAITVKLETLGAVSLTILFLIPIAVPHAAAVVHRSWRAPLLIVSAIIFIAPFTLWLLTRLAGLFIGDL